MLSWQGHQEMTQVAPQVPNARETAPTWGLRCRQALAVCIWVYVALALTLWWMLPQADAWWPATMLMFSPRWVFAVPLPILLICALLLRSKWMIALLLAAGLLVVLPATGFNFPWRSIAASAPAGKSLRVMTLNMHYSHANPERLDALIAETEPDIIAIQEWPGCEHFRLKDKFHTHNEALGRLFLASRHPIARVTSLGGNSTSEQGSVSRYDIEAPMGPIHVFSLHLATTRRGVREVLHEGGKGPADMEVISVLRLQQSEFVAAQAAACKGPVVIVGDFNTPPESLIFRDVWSSYTDAFAVAGWGWGYTFYGGKTMVRIDHVLHTQGWTCTACRVAPSVGSPHRAVIADLVWTGD
jgi:endonuclease/exonuclease/phosphatase family metal-dependent hydrolase